MKETLLMFYIALFQIYIIYIRMKWNHIVVYVLITCLFLFSNILHLFAY
jgi:hypothetical protein